MPNKRSYRGGWMQAIEFSKDYFEALQEVTDQRALIRGEIKISQLIVELLKNLKIIKKNEEGAR